MKYWAYPWYFCLLCGERNDSTNPECKRCGMPRGALLGQTALPAGWAKAEICYDTISPIDETYENARFIVKIETVSGVRFVYPTDSFVLKKWDDWHGEPPPVPTDDENVIRQTLVNQLHNDGWLDTLASDGTPTRIGFWRRSQ